MPALSEQASIHQPSTAAATPIVPEQPEVAEIATAHVDILEDVVHTNFVGIDAIDQNTPNAPMPDNSVNSSVEMSESDALRTEKGSIDISPVSATPIVENTTEEIYDFEAAFSMATANMVVEQQPEAELNELYSQVVEQPDMSGVEDPSIRMVATYNYDKARAIDSKADDEKRDYTSRRVSAAYSQIDHIDKHGKPDETTELLLEIGDKAIPYETAQHVQEAQGKNVIDGITPEEAIINHSSDEMLGDYIGELKNQVGQLDVEKTARTIAAYGQEVFTAEEFREIGNSVTADLSGVDPDSLSNARVGIKDGEFVVIAGDNQVITVLDKAKATVVVSKAIVMSKTAEEELSAEQQQLVDLADKIRKTGFGLSSWRNSMALGDRIVGKGTYADLKVITLDDGQKVLGVDKGGKCKWVEANEDYVLEGINPLDAKALAQCPVSNEIVPPEIEHPHLEAPMPAIPLVQNEKPLAVNPSAEQVSQQPVATPVESLPGQEGHVQVNQENTAVAQIAKPPTIVIGDSLRAAFASTDQVGAFLYTLRQRPTIFQGVFPGFVPGRSFDFLTKGMNPFFASRADNLFRINQHTARLGGRAAENSLQGQVFSVSRSESVAKTNQSKAASVRAEQRVATHEAKATNKSHNVSEKTQEVRHTQHATTEGASEATVSASSTTIHAEAVHTQQSNTEQKAYAGETSKASGQIAQEAHQQAIATGSIEVKAVESSGVVRKGTHEEVSTRQDTKVEASAAKEKGSLHVDNTTSSSVESAGSVQREPVGAETVVKASQESVAQEKSFAQNEVVQYEILHMLTADVGTVIATGVPVLPEGERNKKRTQETIGEDEQARSLGTNEMNMRLDPAMLMSTITTQSFSKPSAQPNSSSAKAIQKPVQVPQIKATLSLARTFSASQNFPVADQHEAKDFVNNVFARM